MKAPNRPERSTLLTVGRSSTGPLDFLMPTDLFIHTLGSQER